MGRPSSVIRPNHELALPSCKFVRARRASQAMALARRRSHAPCAPSGARRANQLCEQMLHVPYDERGRTGVQRMPNFAEVDLSDEELGLILAYLTHMVDRKSQS